MRIFPLILLITSLAFRVEARDVSFSYNTEDLPYHGYGHPNPSSYDICIRIDDPDLRGGIIKSFTVPLPQPDGCSIDGDVSAWVLTSLDKEPIFAANTLAYVKAACDGSSIEAEFPDGIKIPEEGVYVGYSVKVEQNTNGVRTFPIAVVDGTTEGSLYFRSSTLTNWDKTYYRMELMSPMKVNISADLPDYSVVPSLPEKMKVKSSSESSVMLTFTSKSIEPVCSLKYHLSTPEYEEDREIEISSPAESSFGTVDTISIPFPAPSGLGDSSLSIEITEVNRHPNISSGLAKAEMQLRVLPEIPVYRPLVEEYTGLWCGNCPSGWVALEEVREKFGDAFVFMTYHVNDLLTPNLIQPMAPRSVPALSVDREALIGGGELEDTIIDHLGRTSDVDLQVLISWEDSNQQSLKARAITTFMESHSGAEYSVAMYLVADGLSDPLWGQANYFSGQQGKSGKYWDIFTRGGGYVYGLNYDGVAAVCYNPTGKYGNIPNLIYEFESFTTTEVFSLKDGFSVRGTDLLRNQDKIRVVAVLIDELTGKIVNSATSVYTSQMSEQEEPDGVDLIENEPKTLEYEEFYTLEGLNHPAPLKGLPYIRLRHYSDSTVETSKIIY